MVPSTWAPRPFREPADVQALWAGLQGSDVQCVCTDHAPWSLRQKLDPALTVATVRNGVADLETLMPMLFSEGVAKQRLSLSRFVELTSTNAAKLFGLYPQKGTIAVGSDADIVVWDPALTPHDRRRVDAIPRRLFRVRRVRGARVAGVHDQSGRGRAGRRKRRGAARPRPMGSAGADRSALTASIRGDARRRFQRGLKAVRCEARDVPV